MLYGSSVNDNPLRKALLTLETLIFIIRRSALIIATTLWTCSYVKALDIIIVNNFSFS